MLSFLNQGFKVYVASPQDQFSTLLIDNGIEFIPLSKLNNKGTNILGDLNFLKELHSVYHKLKPDFVFHYTVKPNIYGSLACASLKIPSIAITTGLGYAFAEKNLIAALVRQLYKFSLKKAKEVWFLNKDDLDTFIDRTIIQPNKAFLLKSEGVNTTHFSPKEKTTVSKNTVFLFSARLIIDKGIKEFINAIKNLYQLGFDVEGHIVGFLDVKNPNGISKEDLESFMNDSKCIFYKGSTNDVRPFIVESDCVVLPSFYREGVPRILLEAAAMAKPIITTNNVGCKETVDDTITGYLCNPKDVNDLMEKMKSFITLDQASKMEMGAKGRIKILNEFDEVMIINTYNTKLNMYI